MLGRTIRDPYHVESNVLEQEGLGLIDMTTTFSKEKHTVLVDGVEHFNEKKIKGYEIHMGESEHHKEHQPLVTLFNTDHQKVQERTEGILNKEEGILGTYVHGVFDNASFTKEVLNYICSRKGLEPIKEEGIDYWVHRENELTELAKLVRENLNMEALYEIIHES